MSDVMGTAAKGAEPTYDATAKPACCMAMRHVLTPWRTRHADPRQGKQGTHAHTHTHTPARAICTALHTGSHAIANLLGPYGYVKTGRPAPRRDPSYGCPDKDRAVCVCVSDMSSQEACELVQLCKAATAAIMWIGLNSHAGGL